MSSPQQDMRVIKRNGNYEPIAFDKIQTRIKKLGTKAGIHSINYTSLTMKVIDQLYDGIPTTKIDELTAEQCATMAVQHPDYGVLASYIVISNHHKNTSPSFHKAMDVLYNFHDKAGEHTPLISPATWHFIQRNIVELEAMIDHGRDYGIDYFGYKTLERAYLMKVNGVVVERPQHMWLRVAIGIHGTRENGNQVMEFIERTYYHMSEKYFTHATPTLFNAGTLRPQLSSCYLVAMQSDSIDGIFDTLKDCAKISKHAGGIGLHVHNIRAAGSLIRGTNGSSNGIMPMLRVFNNTARYIDQGGKRNGSVAIYLEPWHADVEIFLEMKKNHGDEETKARDLFYALWIPDLFMEKVKSPNNELWCLFCPDECPGLSDVYGEEFNQLYKKYESEGKYRSQVKARDLWLKILDSQMETGTPYLLFKDASNRKSNQKNLGTIKSSNLCTEIIEYSDDKETAVCNLASIALNRFVDAETRTFNYEKLHEVTRIVTDNLNRVIDVNYYPTEKTKLSNVRHRPIGIGVQGLADVFMMMDVAFHSEAASMINRRIFETIYHAALTESNHLAMERYRMISNPAISEQLLSCNKQYMTQDEYANLNGTTQMGAYSSFIGSPASNGELQFDMWGVSPGVNVETGEPYYDWKELKESIMKYGLRNSLLLAPMPTASTSQILGNNECFEPITSNIYTRRTLAGEFIMVNKYLLRELIELGVWNERVKNNIIANNGSVQYIDGLSEHLKNKYKTVWEMPMKHLIDMAADRGAFICQSQSMNLWVEEPNYSTLTSMHFYSWKKGLKTGIYYLRRKAKHQAQQFTIEPEKAAVTEEEHEVCEFCSA